MGVWLTSAAALIGTSRWRLGAPFALGPLARLLIPQRLLPLIRRLVRKLGPHHLLGHSLEFPRILDHGRLVVRALILPNDLVADGREIVQELLARAVLGAFGLAAHALDVHVHVAHLAEGLGLHARLELKGQRGEGRLDIGEGEGGDGR